jgi:hypothetical protein
VADRLRAGAALVVGKVHDLGTALRFKALIHYGY